MDIHIYLKPSIRFSCWYTLAPRKFHMELTEMGRLLDMACAMFKFQRFGGCTDNFPPGIRSGTGKSCKIPDKSRLWWETHLQRLVEGTTFVRFEPFMSVPRPTDQVEANTGPGGPKKTSPTLWPTWPGSGICHSGNPRTKWTCHWNIIFYKAGMSSKLYSNSLPEGNPFVDQSTRVLRSWLKWSREKFPFPISLCYNWLMGCPTMSYLIFLISLCKNLSTRPVDSAPIDSNSNRMQHVSSASWTPSRDERKGPVAPVIGQWDFCGFIILLWLSMMTPMDQWWLTSDSMWFVNLTYP